MCLITLKFSKDRRNIDSDALAICPGCVSVQIDIPGSFLVRHTYLIAFSSLLINILEITFNLDYPFFIRNGAVSRYNCVHVHRQDAIAGPKPVAGRPGPDDGMAADKQDIGCEDNTVSRDVDQGVTKSMSRPDLYEMDFF